MNRKIELKLFMCILFALTMVMVIGKTHVLGIKASSLYPFEQWFPCNIVSVQKVLLLINSLFMYFGLFSQWQ